MRFSEYLRLNEGNAGHEYGEEWQKHEDAKEANREHAAAKRAESTMAPKQPKQPEPPKKADPPKKKDNTVDDHGEVMLDPVTGKPFPKKGPLKDWQIPSLKESERPGEAYNYGRDEEDEPEENTEDDGHAPKPRNTKTVAQLGAEAAARKPVNDSLEIPTRDALGRLSIYSMNEASKSALRRRLASSNVSHAEKQRAQANSNIKDKDSAKRAKATAGNPDTPLDVAVRAGDAMGNKPTPAPKKQRVLTPADKANANKNAPKWVKKKTEEHEQEQALGREADRRADARGMTDRQSHLDEPK